MKVIVLDFTDGSVQVFDYDQNIYEDVDEFIQYLEEGGFISGSSNCQWMAVKELNIKIH